MEYGIKSVIESLPADAPVWGARAIFNRGSNIGLLWNRQSSRGGRPWQDMVNFHLPYVRAAVKRLYNEGVLIEEEVVKVYEGAGITVMARKAGGYLYLTAYGMTFDPDAKWSGRKPAPAPGDEIASRMGPAQVCGFFVEYGYLGVVCKLKSPPEWFLQQAEDGGYAPLACLFGADLNV